MRDVKHGIKTAVIVIALLFLTTSITPIITSTIPTTQQPNNKEINDEISMSPISLYLIKKTGLEKHDITVSNEDATQLYSLFEELKNQMATNPFSVKTRQMQNQFLDLLEEKNALPTGISKDELRTLLQPPIPPPTLPLRKIIPLQNTASEFICTFVSEGSGTILPIIILPRLIPILLTPIPRAFVRWNVKEGFTSCGGLRSGTGFIAVGEQKGVALGFWGIGFTFSLPPVMNTYGLIGYALYATVSADYIEYYPPNNPPVITGVDPSDGQVNVPMSLSELRFRIEDADSDLMSYTVTTEPDIGSGSGSLKSDGVYAVPIQGLESLTQYTWYLSVSDGKDTVGQTMTFTTEPIAPILSNPSPADGERDVSLSLPQLTFTVHDFQGDAMDYTVETSPNVGSGSGTGVHNGTYSIPVSDLAVGTTYHWYINITDGAHWTRKMLSFETGYPAQFDPFDYGWQCRKQITIDHTQVVGDLTNFPVLISTVDADLRENAQGNGEDIMFMNDVGTSTRVYHDLESYDASSGDLVAWMNIPSLSSSNDTILYMYYGNPHCINQAYPEKTWDSNYMMVQHMKDTTILTISDSTVHNNDGTKKGANEPIQITGKIGNGQYFDGSNDIIDLSSPVIGTGVKTVSMWYYVDGGTYTAVLSNCLKGGSSEDDGIGIWQNDGNKIYLYLGDAGAPGVPGHFMVTISSAIATIGKWHYVTCIYDGTTLSIYIDTILAGSTTIKGPNPEVAGSQNLRIGGRHLDSMYNFNGKLDEIRISNIDRDASWISTEYNNQNNPTDFLTFGPEEPGL